MGHAALALVRWRTDVQHRGDAGRPRSRIRHPRSHRGEVRRARLRPWDRSHAGDRWSERVQPPVYRSADGAKTFDTRPLDFEGTHSILGRGNGVVLSDGRFLILFGELRERTRVRDRELKPTEAIQR